ncbi:hypothetical protein J4476_05920 [Candidatus Woesearchaeota archaeon]|nr:hypothetical protein [Candidatus Woesearchaeota archaeon]
MDPLLYSALFGLIGGTARALIGFMKHYRVSKKKKFSINYFLFSILIAGFIGMFVSLIVTSSYSLSLISGYVGIDIVENLIKIYKKKLDF